MVVRGRAEGGRQPPPGGQRRGALTARLGGTLPAASAAPADEPPGDVLATFRLLSAADQEVLSLVAWEDLTPAEAAKVLGIPAARFSVRLHRASGGSATASRPLRRTTTT